MKKFLQFIRPAIFIAILGLTFASCSDDKDEPIDFNQLPTISQNFIKTYFTNVEIVNIIYEKDKNNHEYEVDLENGFELTFNKEGDWTDVNAPNGQTIPDGIAPESIANYVSENYPDYGINEISKEKNGYDVELTNGLDLNFNLQGEFTGIDR
ncbi:MAG: PepSY-like domain-containing protein [Muribaculaceae bacterium]|nr:PepSY-like domain-containing protein [Muribaculaceae bacterium]